ncbi:hypothetical protein K1T71_000739 [Dendrolimus kikuchii]|uniref:Uncharacterized protein n=1 Tax=Dendrolimus kikuchii TaxID=765133 RepID=A0ACC1DKA0_9NEOP|nr:hypothetical protein K1T71_000739 [Dendrolimus kikuchii]
MLLNNKVYLVNLKDEIFECDLESKNFNLTCIHWSGDNILCLGHIHEQVYVMTCTRSIYEVDSTSYIFNCSLNATTNLLNLIKKYNFLEQMEWRQYYHWLFLLNLKMPDDPLRFISTVKSYNDVIFVGTEWGLLRIYYAPYINKKLDIYNSKPVKEFNFSKPLCPVLSNSCILQVEISEMQHGHIVLVGMPKKIAIIKFTHHFEATTSVAMLPYNGAQKRLKI